MGTIQSNHCEFACVPCKIWKSRGPNKILPGNKPEEPNFGHIESEVSESVRISNAIRASSPSHEFMDDKNAQDDQ